jgi:hypothetical protein
LAGDCAASSPADPLSPPDPAWLNLCEQAAANVNEAEAQLFELDR